jgi:general L-amino acid transport system permease protein
MTIDVSRGAGSGEAPSSWVNDPRVRSAVYQIALVLVLGFLIYEAVTNAADNLARAHIASGFGFFDQIAGFSINQTLIPYSETSTYGRAFLVGLLNTLLVSALGVLLATIIGLVIGIARLSRNWIVSRLATAYVEFIRNVPLLLQLVFWYTAVLQPLPNPRQSIGAPNGLLGAGVFISNRGLTIPRPIFGAGFEWVLAGLVVAVVLAFLYGARARRRQMQTGHQSPVLLVSLGLIIAIPAIVFLVLGAPLTFEVPQLKGFNFQGGIVVFPEFVALLMGLSFYTASFIAEVVRAGILAVGHGQTEAAYSLGLRSGPTLRLIILPQAMRVIIPPLTNQYLNLTKNSSLAVAIGYPDLVQVFAGTVLNQTGQAVEVILITMGVYLLISLVTSGLMNWYNRRVAIVER